MRAMLGLFLVTAFGCGGSDDGLPESKLAFTITSTDLTLQPGQEITKCFYFHTPNTEDAVVNKWVSDMTPGSHHMIVFTNLDFTSQPPPDGTIDDCNGGGGVPLPLYGAQTPHQEVSMPADDGFGLPLAQLIAPNTAGYIQMHYLNTGDDALTVHVSLSGYALPTDTMYTRTDMFATYNADISIPPNAMNYTVSASCDVFDKKFWQMSSHSHKQSVATAVMDGSNMVFNSTDWEHPGERTWSLDPGYYQFQNTSITWSCTYNNTGTNANRTITDGQSAQTNEMCMATGYYFPANGAKGCVISGGKCTCLL